MKWENRLAVSLILLCCLAIAQPSDREVISQTAPEYPALLKKLGIGGTVKLSALVAADGTVKKTKIKGAIPCWGSSLR